MVVATLKKRWDRAVLEALVDRVDKEICRRVTVVISVELEPVDGLVANGARTDHVENWGNQHIVFHKFCNIAIAIG